MQINLRVISGLLLIFVTRIIVLIFITSPQHESEQSMTSFWDKFKKINLPAGMSDAEYQRIQATSPASTNKLTQQDSGLLIHPRTNKECISDPRLSKNFFTLVLFLAITTCGLATNSVLANDKNAAQFTRSGGVNGVNVNTDVSWSPVSSTVTIGGGALAEFSQTSADGCVITFGSIAAVQARRGDELADGLYVTGMQEDVCAGTGNGFAGFEPLSVAVHGLASAHVQGTVVAPSYSGGAPATFELNLHFAGYDAITRQHGFYHDGSTIDFSFNRSRAAQISGTFTLDGEDMTVTSASLVQETSGTIQH